MLTHRIGVGRRDDFVDFLPFGTDEPAMAAHLCVGIAFGLVLDNRCPGGDWRLRRPGLPPQFEEARPDEGVFHPVGGIHVPGVAGASGTPARFVIGQIGPRAWIIGLLGFPSDDPTLDIDFP